jgi:DNA-directed RNA polymerase III subunit RPC8
MFNLCEITDNVRVHPEALSLPRSEALINELNGKYANKVLHNIGLCIRVLDITRASEGTVFSCQDGAYSSQGIFLLLLIF